MVTCKHLMQLDSFRGVKLMAGASGLDHIISWPYPKHTKSITPWVKNGEFVMVSGFEIGVNEDELLSLIEEAGANQLSGILVEGGINFKELTPAVIKKADLVGIPLFFTPNVVSFLDLSREISSMILEQELIQKYSTSLLDQLLKPNTLTEQEARHLLEDMGIAPYNLLSLARFTVSLKDPDAAAHNQTRGAREKAVLQALGKLCTASLESIGLQVHEQKGLDALTLLLYAPDRNQLAQLQDSLIHVRNHMEALHSDCQLLLSFSKRVQTPLELEEALFQVVYTDTLAANHLVPGPVQAFEHTGSYRLLYHIADKEVLLEFRDDYLRELYLADQSGSSELLKTLRSFLLNCGNMMRTAEQLYTHRNTLQYRLDKIKTITGHHLSDATVRRDFLNALMILDLYPFSTAAE